MTEEIERLQSRNDKLMRVICSLDKLLRFSDAQLMQAGTETFTVVTQHRALDAARAKRATNKLGHDHTEAVVRAIRSKGKRVHPK
jgi:hypothetical protein